jgi:hypothetical protein
MSTSSSINEFGVEAGMSAEELEIAKQEWSAELNQVEEEIQTLRHVWFLTIFWLYFLCDVVLIQELLILIGP